MRATSPLSAPTLHPGPALRGDGLLLLLALILHWIAALVRRIRDPRPPLTAAWRIASGLNLLPLATRRQEAAAYHRYCRHVVQAQPSVAIARRVARRLGLPDPSDFCPCAASDPPTPPASPLPTLAPTAAPILPIAAPIAPP